MENWKNNRILLIDDNPEIHKDFRKVLGNKDTQSSVLDGMEAVLFDGESEPAGGPEEPSETFEIDSAYQGQEGLEMVRSALETGRPYAMAFVDVRMPPGWDGVETIAQIWRQYPQLQVVICTAYSDYSWTEIVRNLGATDSLVILKKPFDNIEVLQLAHAMTKKWVLTQQANSRLEDLDRMVHERTRELEAANERFSKAFKSSPLPMAICEIGGARFADVNESLLKLFQFIPADIVGRSEKEVAIWADTADQERFWFMVQRCGNVREMKCRVRTKSGAMRDALIFAEELKLHQERSLLILFHDITQQLKLEEQVRHSQKMEAVGQLAAGVAHDFNNLLTVIRGHAELRLGAAHLDREIADSLKQISRASDRASSLTRQLLAFSRRYMIQPRPLDINSLITRHQEMARSLISEQIEFRSELTSSLPPARADQNHLEQVLMNLIVNARDAMPEGGQLTIRTSAVKIDSEQASLEPELRSGSYVCIAVQDTGCGMSQETLSRIFEPFFTTKQMGRGTGMGLATVYGIVKQHGGWIKVASQPGQGSTFSIFLPAATGPAESTSETPEPVGAGGHETVLVVEDDAHIRAMATDVLGSVGYRVLQADSGVDALRVWSSENQKVDLLFSDVVMPAGMNGRKLAETLRSQKPNLKILLTTGHSSPTKEEIAQVPGANFMAKPYSAADLVKGVRSCLDN